VLKVELTLNGLDFTAD
jgi:hypothetical protein